jgi:hypothetical protein
MIHWFSDCAGHDNGPHDADKAKYDRRESARMGVSIIPPNPAFYNKPRPINDMVDHIVARVQDQVGVATDLTKRWDGKMGGAIRAAAGDKSHKIGRLGFFMAWQPALPKFSPSAGAMRPWPMHFWRVILPG